MISEGEVLIELQRVIGDKIADAFTGEVIANDEAESKARIKVVRGKKQDGEKQISYDARLKSIVDEKDKHFIAIPKVGSEVFCVSLGNSKERYVAVRFNEIEKIIYKGEKVSLVIDDNEGTIVLNDGENGGLTITSKTVEKLNAIENELNGLKQAFAGWTVVAQDGGAALRTAIVGAPTGPALPGTWAGSELTGTKDADIMNDKIKH